MEVPLVAGDNEVGRCIVQFVFSKQVIHGIDGAGAERGGEGGGATEVVAAGNRGARGFRRGGLCKSSEEEQARDGL